MSNLPGTGPQGPEPEPFPQPKPVTIIDEAMQMWEQMMAAKSKDILENVHNSEPHLKRKYQIRLQLLDVMVSMGKERFQAQG